MTVLLLATSAKLSERLVRFTHYLVFKDRLSAFASCEQTLIIPNWSSMSTANTLFIDLVQKKFEHTISYVLDAPYRHAG